MAIVIEDSFSDNGGANETSMNTRSFSPTAGNVLYIRGSCYASSGDSSASVNISDSLSHTWTPVVARTKLDDGGAAAPPPIRGWMTEAAGGSMTVTITKADCVGFALYCSVKELSGVDTSDPIVDTDEATATTAPLNLTLDTTGADGALMCLDVVDWGEDVTAPTAASGTTLDHAMATADIQGSAALHKFPASAGSNTVGIATPTSGDFNAIAVAFRPASGSGTNAPAGNASATATANNATVTTSNIYKVADRGTAQNLTGETSTLVDLAAGASIATGNYLIARLALDNAGTNGAAVTLTVTDPKSHTWTILGPANIDPGAANAGSTCYIAYTKVTTPYANGDDLTFGYTAVSTTAKAIVVEEWANIHATTPVAVAATTATGTSATPSISKTPGAATQVFYGALAIEGPSGDTYTQDADTTDGSWQTLTSLSTTSGTAASNQSIRGAFKLVSGTTAQTWNPSITSRDWAQVAVIFAQNVNATNAPAESAAATATASAASLSIAPNAGTATASVTANDATVTTGINVAAGNASATTQAADATASAGVQASPATVTAQAGDASTAIATLAASAAASVTANDATVSTAPTVNAPAESAATAVTANDASTAISATAQPATATAQASNAAASVGSSAATATAAVTANDATVETSSSAQAPAGVAAVSIVAGDASIAAQASAVVAEATAIAQQAAAAISVTSGIAQAAVTANDATVSTAQGVALAGLASVAVTANNATVSVTGEQILRPDDGSTARPSAGVILRPDLGLILRP